MLLHAGLGVMAAIFLLGLMASPLTLIASSWILWRYRRAVARFMAAAAGEARSVPAAEPAGAIQSHAVAAPPQTRTADHLYRSMIAGLRRRTACYALAGLLFALLMGLSAFFAFSQTEVNHLRAAAHPLQLLFLVWTFAWPMVLTVPIVAAAGRRHLGLIVVGYFAVLAVLGGLIALTSTEAAIHVGSTMLPAWSGESPLRLASKWSLFNLLPTLLLLIFRHRRVRAVAPLVLSFMTVVSAGVLGILAAASVYWQAAVAAIANTLGTSTLVALIGYFLVLLVMAYLVFGAAGWWLLAWLRSAYLRKTVSDQSLAVDALWLIFAASYAVMLAFAGPGWALAALLAFCAFKIVISALNKRRLSIDDGLQHAPALLVLRVFSLGKRSEALFDAVTQHWRHIGNVQLIAGTDLAFSTVAPHRFLAFVSGQLKQLFIRGSAALERGVAEIDTRRDADGRFRINDFFCHADTWQSVLSRLIGTTDVVLMDLRSFTQNNAGCVFEIKALLNAVPLTRLVFVTDDTTDNAFLTQVLAQTWRALSSASPNAALSPAALQLFSLRSARGRDVEHLLRQLCAGAMQHAPLR
jgi:hypothetical protein